MRILGTGPANAATYYRIQSPLSVIRYRTGHECRMGGLHSDIADSYDVVMVSGLANPSAELILREFHEAGGGVVVDIDDWLFGVPASWPCYSHYYSRGNASGNSRLTHLERLLRMADVITCPTEYLADKLRDYLDVPEHRVRVLPNCILMGDWDILAQKAHDMDGPVLGWFGTENHWDDWWEIAPYVDEALDYIDGHLALIGAPELISMFPDRLAKRTMIHPLVPFDQFDRARALITSFDLGLAWCTDRTEASKCRSPLKAIQYGAAGVPVLASRTVYGDVPGFPDTYGLTVEKPQDLVGVISWAFEHYDAMMERANRWKTMVWELYSYEMQALRWLGPLKKAADNKRKRRIERNKPA